MKPPRPRVLLLNLSSDSNEKACCVTRHDLGNSSTGPFCCVPRIVQQLGRVNPLHTGNQQADAEPFLPKRRVVHSVG
jgi:hypothetical protein